MKVLQFLGVDFHRIESYRTEGLNTQINHILQAKPYFTSPLSFHVFDFA